MDLPKAYDHTKVETDIYKQWLASGYFTPENLPNAEKREAYTIIMPPPNANAPSHVGHALGYTIQDILIRFERMRGKKTLWLPGSDHAGFETQVVFEKYLEKQGRSRFKMTREEFYKECWGFVQNNKHLSEAGIKRLGSSCDWSRNVFTLDPEIVKIVYQTFQQMHCDGLIYRSGRICNWCPKHQTGLSDLETKYEERQETFYFFKYGPFTIGTSRPETKFGDKYVVMHPKDKRYKKYKTGDTFTAEWINGPIKATIIKDEIVDMEFGTGVMTITPAHDPVDFDIAQRHNLDSEQIIDMRGKLLPIAEEFAGMKILEARPKIVEKLKSKGLLEKIDERYKHSVQLCYKCGSLIEPQVVPQWYVKMTEKLPDGRPSLRDMAFKSLDKKEVVIVTERFEKIFRHWMENIHDWPISRQIWWGIPIPVCYCKQAISNFPASPAGRQFPISKQIPNPKSKIINPKCEEPIIDIDNTITSCPHCQGEIQRDSDTFDTWFSSGQWPYATLMANDAKGQRSKVKGQRSDFQSFFPTQVMETAHDILFFWVARMIMFSYYKTGKPPFEKVFLHGLVRDKDRQKMSKSKGNVIDPLGVIDTYGTDALRFALIFSTSAGNDIPLAEDKIKGMKHFGNKLWNIARYILSVIPDSPSVIPDLIGNPEKIDSRLRGNDKLTPDDKDILAKLNATIKSVTNNLENLRLHEAAQGVYHFVWREFADVYIEQSKKQLAKNELKQNTLLTLHYCLLTILKLLHPFMPFITEHIWQLLKDRGLVKTGLLMVEDWPSLTRKARQV